MEILRTIIGYLEMPLAISFLLGGLVKLILPGNARVLEKTAPALLIRQFGLKRFTGLAVRVLGASECVLALAIFSVGSAPIVAFLTLMLCAAAFGTVLWGKLKYPEASCGCLGAHSSRIDFKSILRIGGFLLEALALVLFRTSWDAVPYVQDRLTRILVIIPAIAAMFALGYFWRGEFGSVRSRIVVSTKWHRFAAALVYVPGKLDRCEKELISNKHLVRWINIRVRQEMGPITGSTSSSFFEAAHSTLRWKDKCWCFIEYQCNIYDGKTTSVVAAFHVVGSQRKRISIVDGEAKASILIYDSMTKNFIPEETDEEAQQVLEILNGKVRLDAISS